MLTLHLVPVLVVLHKQSLMVIVLVIVFVIFAGGGRTEPDGGVEGNETSRVMSGHGGRVKEGQAVPPVQVGSGKQPPYIVPHSLI